MRSRTRVSMNSRLGKTASPNEDLKERGTTPTECGTTQTERGTTPTERGTTPTGDLNKVAMKLS